MKIKSWLGFIFLLATGCTLFSEEEERYLPYSDNAALLSNYTYISHTSSSVIYEAEVSGLASYNGNMVYDEDEFTVEGAGTFQILDFIIGSTPAGGNSSTVLLIDQSGSYLEIDPYNNRTKAMNKFLEDFASPNDFLVGGFSKSGSLNSEPVEYPTDNFSTSWADQSFLFGLAARTGGSSLLYDGLDDALDRLSVSQKPVKNIVVLMHASDASSSETIQTVISKANLINVKIHVIIYGPQPYAGDVWELSDQTGGMFAVCTTDSDIITVFNNFQRLLHTEFTVNKLQIQFTPTAGNIVSGNEYENTIAIVDKFSGYELNKVFVKMRIP